MSGIVIAGANTVPVGLIQSIFKAYWTILRGTHSRNDVVLMTRYRSERARFETTVQLLSELDPTDTTTQRLVTILMRPIARDLGWAAEMVHRREVELGNLKFAVKWPLIERKLEVIISQVSDLNDELLKTLQMGNSAAVSQITTRINDFAPPAGMMADSIIGSSDSTMAVQSEGPAEENISTHTWTGKQRGEPRGKLLELLVGICQELMNLFSNEQPKYVELLNHFKLWRLAVESERLYYALDSEDSETQDSSRIQCHDLANLLFRSTIRIGQVLVWWAQRVLDPEKLPTEWNGRLARCTVTITRIHTELPSLPNVGMDDFANASRSAEESTKAALRTIGLCIQTLHHCLPSTVSFARQFPILIEHLPASEVVPLFDAFTDLIEPASKALNAAKLAAVNRQPNDAIKVDLEHIQAVFDEQTAVLQNWKAKHKQDIEPKLVEKSPAKLDSVADAIENIASVLLDLPGALESGTGFDVNRKRISERMKGFEASVQSLVTLEPLLESAKLPPPYQNQTGNRVIISVAGAPYGHQYTGFLKVVEHRIMC